jgi:hypothetical protein
MHQFENQTQFARRALLTIMFAWQTKCINVSIGIIGRGEGPQSEVIGRLFV